MTSEMWIAFVFASGIILIIPGPTIILVISQAISHGRGVVIPLVVGVTMGDFTAMTLSILGLGAILKTSAALYTVLKWIGAAYLIYLGIKLWRSSSDPYEISVAPKETSNRLLFQRAFIVTALNPKSIAFFVAFLPQFIHPHGQTFPQFLILGSTFLFLASINAMIYAIFAGQLRDTMQNEKVRRWFNRCGGSALIGAGLLISTTKHSS